MEKQGRISAIMADERRARPVSGEIMTGMASDSGPERNRREMAGDIVDADYETLPRIAVGAVPVQSPRAAVPAPTVEGMEMLRRQDAAPVRGASLPGGPIFWIAGVVADLAAFWISGGHALVRNLPLLATGQEAGVALSISGVTSRVDASGAKPVLFVDGEAVNDGTEPSPLPPLEIKVLGHDGRVTRYTLGTSGRPLAPGERFAFSSRLEVPKNGVKTVSVIFAE